MAKVTAPLLSLGAKGMVGKKVVFQKRPSGHSAFWNKGHADNPSEASLAQRAWFVEAKNAWNELSDEDKQVYIDRAKLLPDKPMTGYNLYISEYSGVAPEPTYEWSLQEIIGSGIKWFVGACINTDGSRAIVGQYSGRLYILEDGAWTEEKPAGDVDSKWYAVAINEDGSKAIAGNYYNCVYTYNNGSWTEHTLGILYRRSWSEACITSDGSKATICSSYGRIWQYDWNSWTEIRPKGDVDSTWINISMSDDGTKMLAVNDSGEIYEYDGSSWTLLEPEAGVTQWYRSAHMSKNGDLVLTLRDTLYSYVKYDGKWTKRYIADSDEMFNQKCRISNNQDKFAIPYGLETVWKYNGAEFASCFPEDEIPSENSVIDMSKNGEVMIVGTNSKKIYIRKQA